jgi:hypothetical protein
MLKDVRHVTTNPNLPDNNGSSDTVSNIPVSNFVFLLYVFFAYYMYEIYNAAILRDTQLAPAVARALISKAY